MFGSRLLPVPKIFFKFSGVFGAKGRFFLTITGSITVSENARVTYVFIRVWWFLWNNKESKESVKF